MSKFICITPNCPQKRISNQGDLKDHQNHKTIQFQEYQQKINSNAIILQWKQFNEFADQQFKEVIEIKKKNYLQCSQQIEQLVKRIQDIQNQQMEKMNKLKEQCNQGLEGDRFSVKLNKIKQEFKLNPLIFDTISQINKEEFESLSTNGKGIDLIEQYISDENQNLIKSLKESFTKRIEQMKLKKLVVSIDQIQTSKMDIVDCIKGFISKVKSNIEKIYRKEQKGEGQYNEEYTAYSVIAQEQANIDDIVSDLYNKKQLITIAINLSCTDLNQKGLGQLIQMALKHSDTLTTLDFDLRFIRLNYFVNRGCSITDLSDFGKELTKVRDLSFLRICLEQQYRYIYTNTSGTNITQIDEIGKSIGLMNKLNKCFLWLTGTQVQQIDQLGISIGKLTQLDTLSITLWQAII